MAGKRSSGPQDWPPAPPDGYRLHHDPEPDWRWYHDPLLIAWFPFGVLGTFAVAALTHGLSSTIEMLLTFVPRNPVAVVIYMVWILALVVLLVVIHELLHALAALALGYEFAIRVEIVTVLDWSAWVLTYGKFQTRRDTALITAAPLVLFTPFAVAAIAFGGEGLVLAAGLLLAANTVGAIGDVQTVLMMLAFPPGELLYQDDTGRRQYYVPEKSG